ncbi:hypothetical protein NUU61_005830 [Penicillium alfredii]|uniref:Major facilitator superfamily (MFS) profile domain-containing protein n=1 Tax=Penicillium alfredii TaxID=1506179 RepID=A0A9W9FA94_9EURO|nr:uncharacterized protein NUU61_005830 [Penicillium alfredii]KAJ5096474.1 hypothetical protein NUU61_005830 [Penicillium alfredii]
MFTDLFLYAMIVPVMPTALVDRAGVAYEDRMLMPCSIEDLGRSHKEFIIGEHWNSILLIAEAVSALVSSPIFGYALDVSGTRQGLYLLGLILLAGSMAALTAARSVAWYVVARVLQGSATAMVAVAGLAIVTDTVDKKQLGQMLGYIGTATTLGFMAGPLLGGIVYQEGGFYAVFGMAFGIVGLDMFLRLAVVEKRTANRWLSSPSDSEHLSEETSDDPQETSATSSESEEPSDEASMRKAPSSDGEQQPDEKRHGPKESAVGASVQVNTSTPATDDRTRKGRFALLKLLKQPRILIIGWAVIVSSIVFSSFDATLPIFVQDTFHWNALGQGLVFLPPCVASILQPLFGYLSDKFGARWITFTGFVALAPCLICLRLIERNTLTEKVILCLLLGLVGACADLTIPALLVELQMVLDDMEEKEPGVFGENGAIAQAFSLETMAQFGGLALGPLISGFVDDHYGWKVMTLLLGILAGITAIPMLWLSGGRRVWPEKAPEDA